METIQAKPKILIYETVDDTPIYYKNYRDYLGGNKQLEEIMGNCFLEKGYKSYKRLYSKFGEDVK